MGPQVWSQFLPLYENSSLAIFATGCFYSNREGLDAPKHDTDPPRMLLFSSLSLHLFVVVVRERIGIVKRRTEPCQAKFQ